MSATILAFMTGFFGLFFIGWGLLVSRKSRTFAFGIFAAILSVFVTIFLKKTFPELSDKGALDLPIGFLYQIIGMGAALTLCMFSPPARNN
ncbi:MAG: hypothetical protein RLZZ342_659 [Candidatus Parcubacteria bacterium]|jgi:uncharacterized membrane protein